jgi:uncharacterized protein (UPF0261 family)
MTRTVAIVGALDTKAADFAYLRERIEAAGAATLLIDIGILGAPGLAADVDRGGVAAAGGGNLADFQDGSAKDEAMQVMARGVRATVERLHAEGRIHAIVGMGGTGGTSIAAGAMRALPMGVPKLMVSTVAGGDVSGFAQGTDIVFLPSIVDVAGLNSVSRKVYAQAAAAIAAMMNADPPPAEDRPPIVASMFGNTTTAIDHARGLLEGAGYEVLVFHATGSGGRTMEALIGGGQIVASLDLTTTELADHVAGGVMSAGVERCLAAARAGIPAVLAPGCVDMVNFHGVDTMPERYRNRQLYQWNPNTTLMRTDAAENAAIGQMIAEAANAARGPVTVLLPLRGVSMLGAPGGRFHDPVADKACFDAIRARLRPDIHLMEIDAAINDPTFSRAAAEELLRLIAISRTEPQGA